MILNESLREQFVPGPTKSSSPPFLVNYPAHQASALTGYLILSSPQTLGLTQMREAVEKSQKHWVALYLTNTGLKMIKISIVGFQEGVWVRARSQEAILNSPHSVVKTKAVQHSSCVYITSPLNQCFE